MRTKNKLCLLIFTLILFTGIPKTSAIENNPATFNAVEIKNGSNVSITDCVSAALKNSPKIKRQKYNLDIAKSNVGIAKSRYFPVISAGVGFYNENNSNEIYYNRAYRDLPSVGVTINKMVWDFGKTTAYIKMEEFYKLGAQYEFMDSICATLFDIKYKYYKVLRAKALLSVAESDVKINENFVRITHKEPDSVAAKVNLGEAKVKLIEAQNEYKNAKTDLANSMYLDEMFDFNIKNTPTFAYNNDYVYGKTSNPQKFKYHPFDFDTKNATEIAYKNSPDLQILISTKNAMEQSLKYVKRTYLPDLNANVGYGFLNTNLYDTNNSLRVGVNLDTSVNIMELRHNIKGADAQLNLAENEILLFKKDLYYEVQRALNNVEKASKQIPVAQQEAQNALKYINLVEEKYKHDQIDYSKFRNARKEYIEAQSEYIKSLSDYNLALIQLEMAMHYHIVDIHHKSEHAIHYHSDEILEHLDEVFNCDEAENK